MTGFGVFLTVVALLAIAAAILLFERRRSEQIERDLRAARGRPTPRNDRSE